MKRWILVGLCLLSVACRGRAEPSRPAPEAPEAAARVRVSEAAARNLGVVVEAVSPERFGPRVTVPAAIEADPTRMAQVGARVTGRVIAIRAAVGDEVAVGAPLVEIDTIELHQVSTEYQTAVARVRQTDDALTRARALQAERVGATQDLRRAEAESATARAELHEAEEHLHVLGLRDEDIVRLRSVTSHGRASSVLRAPIAGVVVSLSVSIGRVVSGEDVVAVVGRTDRVWASLRVFEYDLSRVAVGARVTLTLPGSAREFTGRLAVLSPVLDAETRTAEGRLAFDNPDGALRPGASALASIALPADAAALWLPREAVQLHDGAPVVFVPAGDGAFVARPVVVGEEVHGRVPVLRGLAPGERVVTRGAFALRGELHRGELEEEE